MSGLRVISGTAGGLRLKSVPGDTTRPITDLVKGALFDIIGNDIIGSKFLDLFGGTGSVGIEALSRGAESTTFIDINRAAIETIRFNLERTKLVEKAVIYRLNSFSYLNKLPDQSYDYIFIAPPQYKNLWIRAIHVLDSNHGWLSPDGWIIVQIHPVEYEELLLTHIFENDKRHYGSTDLIFFQKALT